MTRLRVSVIVPTWNEYPQIVSLLKSLKSQKMSPEEVILVDKHSTDDTVPSTLKFGVDVYYHSGSVAQARNLGVEKCSGEIVAFTEGDVVVPPEWISRIASIFEEEPDLLALSGPGYPCRRGEAMTILDMEYRAYNAFRAAMGRRGCFMCSGYNLAVRREVFKKVRFPDIIPNDDGLFGSEVSKLGFTLFSPEIPVLISPRRFWKMGFLQANLYYLFMLENLSPALAPLARKIGKRSARQFHEVRI